MNHRTFRADDKLNHFSDRDEMWGPLLFLRPAPHQPITAGRALTIAALLGGFYGMLGNVMLALMVRGGAGGHKPSVIMMPLILTSMYFVCAQISIFGAWNRRARQLSRQKSWAELTRRAPPAPRDDETAAE